MRTLGVVLAGGASSRMGAPKWQLRLRDGQTLLARACEAMRNVCDEVVVLGKRLISDQE